MYKKIVLLSRVHKLVADAAFGISYTESLLSFSTSRYGNVYSSTPPFCSNAG
jgi:hypothetical protein